MRFSLAASLLLLLSIQSRVAWAQFQTTVVDTTPAQSNEEIDGLPEVDISFFAPGQALSLPTTTESEKIQRIEPVVAAANSTLTGRSMSDWYDIYYMKGSYSSFRIPAPKNYTVYSSPVGNAQLLEFYQAADTFGDDSYNKGLRGSEANGAYYRFSLGGLSLVAIAYGPGNEGDNPFNWADFREIAKALYRKTLRTSDLNESLNGYLQLTDGSIAADFYVVTSLGDQFAASTGNVDSSGQSGDGTGSSPGGRRRRDRLHQKRYINMGNFRVSLKVTATQITSAVMYQLAMNAYSALQADSGMFPMYQTFEIEYANAVFQLQPDGGNYWLPKETMGELLQLLLGMAKARGWAGNEGKTGALAGKLVGPGNSLLRFAFRPIIPVNSMDGCNVVNPDGKIALACFIRDMNS